MAYTTLAQVKKRSQKNLSPDDAPTAYDSIIEEGMEWALVRINGKLADKFPSGLPAMPSTPSLIQHIAADLAAYFALVESFSGAADNEPTLLAQELKNRAFEALQEIVDGESSLPSTEGSTLQSASVRARATGGALLNYYSPATKLPGGPWPT